MTLLQFETNTADTSLPILRLGFRPFFILAGASAVCLILVWLLILNGNIHNTAYVGANWHAHEMLFGYTVAVISGFLLTAERNWTNVQTLHGKWLGVLALLWLAGRLVPWLALPPLLIAIIDLSFLPILGLVLLRPLLQTRQYQHLVFVIIVTLLFVANLLFHLNYLHPSFNTAAFGLRLAWMTIVILIAVMGGRVIPFFIERGTGTLKTVYQSRVIDIAGFISLLTWILASLITPAHVAVAYLAIMAGVLQLLRLGGWYLAALWRVPMLWILYLGYAWLPVGLFLYAYAVFTTGSVSPAIHAFTAGAIGMITIGMMARVSLGHTGREITASPLLIAAFVLVSIGALIRVLGPLLLTHLFMLSYHFVITSAGLLWADGFILFFIVYAPILTRARVDGKAG